MATTGEQHPTFHEDETPYRYGPRHGRECKPSRHHRDCDYDGEPRYDTPYYVPNLLDLAIAKRYEFGSLFLLGASCLQKATDPYLWGLGYRFAEAARLTQAVKQSFWQTLLPWPWAARPWEVRRGEERCERCGCREEECRCEHREERECREEHRYHDDRRCHKCGCLEEDCHCGCHGASDLRLGARKGDVRSKVILIENNSPRTLTVTLEADPWIDSSGTTVPTTITFDPAQPLVLAPGEARESTAKVTVSDPLASGVSYFTRIHLKGSCGKPISVELCVEAQNCIDIYAPTDPCRPRRGSFVEYCHEPDRDECYERERHHHHHRYDPCDPWRRGFADPCRFWYGSQYIRRFWLTPPLGSRCC